MKTPFTPFPFEDFSKQIQDQTIVSVLDWTDGYTYYVQLLCNRLFISSGKQVHPELWKEEAMKLLKGHKKLTGGDSGNGAVVCGGGPGAMTQYRDMARAIGLLTGSVNILKRGEQQAPIADFYMPFISIFSFPFLNFCAKCFPSIFTKNSVLNILSVSLHITKISSPSSFLVLISIFSILKFGKGGNTLIYEKALLFLKFLSLSSFISTFTFYYLNISCMKPIITYKSYFFYDIFFSLIYVNG